MSRFGGWMLILFASAIGLFALVVHRSRTVQQPIVEAAAPTFSPKRGSVGALVIPVAGVRPEQLGSTWGDARGDGSRAHHAIDIPAARGTPVVAAAGGTVEKLFESRNGGHTIYVRVDPATIHYYAHLDAYAPDLREGMVVTRGQRIGAVGSSGDASPEGPHLHFEVKRMGAGEQWWEGTEIDPYPILAGKAQ